MSGPSSIPRTSAGGSIWTLAKTLLTSPTFMRQEKTSIDITPWRKLIQVAASDEAVGAVLQ